MLTPKKVWAAEGAKATCSPSVPPPHLLSLQTEQAQQPPCSPERGPRGCFLSALTLAVCLENWWTQPTKS